MQSIYIFALSVIPCCTLASNHRGETTVKLVSEQLTGEKYNTFVLAKRERGAHTHTHTNPFRLIQMHRHKLFHPVITLRHPGPPSDINISVIKPKETPAVSKSKFRLEGDKTVE